MSNDEFVISHEMCEVLFLAQKIAKILDFQGTNGAVEINGKTITLKQSGKEQKITLN